MHWCRDVCFKVFRYVGLPVSGVARIFLCVCCFGGFCNVGRVYCGLGMRLLVLVEVVRYVFLSGSL